MKELPLEDLEEGESQFNREPQPFLKMMIMKSLTMKTSVLKMVQVVMIATVMKREKMIWKMRSMMSLAKMS